MRQKIQEKRKEILHAQEYRCFYCANGLEITEATSDHVFPKSMGFVSLSGNHVVSCYKCNNKKGDEFPTLELIQKAIKLYEKMDKIFHPHMAIETKDGPFVTYYEVAKAIGIRKFGFLCFY